MPEKVETLKGAIERNKRARARLLEDDEVDRMIAERDGVDDEEQDDDNG